MHIWGHFKTITKHKILVGKLCFKVHLYKQGLLHDLSKYTPTEFITGIKDYKGTYSPNSAERNEKGYSTAWLHHKGRNKHHWEYWLDFGVNGIYACKMPTNYVIEMFCDRVAASKIYQGKKYTDKHPLEYFMRSKGRRPIDPNTSDTIEGLLRTLAEDGEDAAFAAVRKMLKESKSAR